MGISDQPVFGSNNVVEFKTNEIKPIKQLFDSIKNKLPDTSLLFDSTSVKILQMNAATTFLVDVRLDGENFQHYFFDSSREDTLELNISADMLNSVFKCVSKDDAIFHFQYEYDKEIIITIENPKKNEYKTFEIPLQAADGGKDIAALTDNQLETYDYRLSMPIADFAKICSNLKNMNCEMVNITHDGNKLSFSSVGGCNCVLVKHGTDNPTDTDSMIISKIPDDPNIGPYKGSFKFSTLCEFSKSQGNGDGKIVQILLSQDRPIILLYDVGTLGQMYIALAGTQEEN